MSSLSTRWVSSILTLLIFFRSVTLANAQHANDDVLEAFYSSSRIFEQAPPEGITVISTERVTTSYLVNGTTDDLVLQFVFKPAADVSPTQYTTSFVCNSRTIWEEQSCSVNNAEAAITGTSNTAYNTSVTCAFSKVPGSTECQLIATLRDSARQSVNRPFEMQPAARQTARYESEVITNNVYGVVFFIPDSNGQLSADAQIVSGESNSYKLSTYDRTEQDIREISTYALIPGGQGTGTAGLGAFSTAETNLDFGDFIFRYDPSCELTSAAIENGVISLPNAARCGVGMAVQDETTYPKLGVKFREYKSGKITMRLFWDVFGTSDEPYEQIVTFEIQEVAPPVITAVEKLDFYKSVPCEVEILKVIAYNVRYADTRQVVVFSIDGQSSLVWSQAVGGFRYDADADMSELTFESGGGTGQGVSFGLQASFDTEVRQAVTLDLIDLTLVFTTPILLTGLNQTVVQVDGGELLELSGALQGFGVEDSLYVGSFQIPGVDLISFDSEKLVFFSPPLSDLGSSFSYPITLGICAERSNALTLQYQAAPILKISSSDSSTDGTGAYVIKASGETSFVAEVTGNNIAVTYVWKLFNSAGEEVSTGDAVTNSQVFLVSPSLLQSTLELYTLRATVKNALDLSATEEVSIMKVGSQEEYVLVNVHELPTIQRSLDASTLVQAHVTTATSDDPTIVLEWKYREKVYKVSEEVFQSENGTVRSQATGPKRFGLEFFIMQEDLVVGSQDVSLTASLAANPDIKGGDTIALVVVASPLSVVINDGINGTLLLTGSDLLLSGWKSVDPDVFPGEGDDRAGVTYEWMNCRKALQSSFTKDVSDCSTLFPTDTSSVNITIPNEGLRLAQLATEPAPPSTYLSFGLRIRKGTRTAETFLYIELRAGEEAQKIPTLTTLEIVDRKGTKMARKDLSTFGDIIIQPTSEDTLVSWSFDMSLRNQRYLFTRFGALKNGTGFMPNRGVKSRLPLGFNPGFLDANTEYRIEVSVSASDTDQISSYELSFQTAEVPSLTCTPPEETTGVISETMFTVGGTLSFETQDIEYCFFLTTSTERFILGNGCSSVPFATFSFYRAGTYGISCVAKTGNGYMVDEVSVEDAVVLTTPATSTDEIETLSDRLTKLVEEVTRCEAVHDDACLVSLISVAKDFAVEVEQATTGGTTAQSDDLRARTKGYITRLASLSDSLAENTVFRANQVAPAVDLSYNLLLVPAAFIVSEEVLYSTLRQAEVALAATSGLVPIASEELVKRVSTIGNRTIGTAYGLAAGGSSRRRLRAGGAGGVLGDVLFRVPRLVAEARAQQAECEFRGVESTVGGGVRLPEVRVGVRVRCGGVGGVDVGGVSVGVCEVGTGRVVLTVARIPGVLIMASGLVDVLVEMGALVGVGESVSEGCVEVVIPTDVGETDLVAGSLEKGGCDGCLEVKRGEKDVVVVKGGVVKMTVGRTGMFVVGRSVGVISGRGVAVWLVVLGVLVVVGAVVGVGMWTGGGVVDSGGEGYDEVFDWEYIERDMWGRETEGKTEL